jgi:hypothetical protein
MQRKLWLLIFLVILLSLPLSLRPQSSGGSWPLSITIQTDTAEAVTYRRARVTYRRAYRRGARQAYRYSGYGAGAYGTGYYGAGYGGAGAYGTGYYGAGYGWPGYYGAGYRRY